jgi:hypothetical protein
MTREVAVIEEAMYAGLDALSDAGALQARDFLRAYVSGSPAGEALARRIALTDRTDG